MFKKCQESFGKCSISLQRAVGEKYTLAQCLIHVSPSVTDGAKEAEYDSVSIRNPNAIDESNQEFPQLEDKRPEQPTEEKESTVNVPPEHEEANFSDNREAEEGYDSERGSLLEDTSSGSDTSPGQSAREDIAAGNLLGLGYFVLLLLKRSMVECFLGKYQGFY